MIEAERRRRLDRARAALADESLSAFDRAAAWGDSRSLGVTPPGPEGLAADLALALAGDAKAGALRGATLDLLEILSLPSSELGVRGDAAEARIVEVLRLRSACENVRIVIESLGFESDATSDLIDACLEFDDCLAPVMHRLVTFNAVREPEAAVLDRGSRARYPWWVRGVGIRPDAVAVLPEVAALVVAFPEAEAELTTLQQVERSLRRPPGSLTNVTSLGAWIRARVPERREPGALRMAAAGAATRESLIRRPEFELSWMEPSLLVLDVLAPLRAGLVPTLRLPGGTIIPAALVEGTLDRYAFEIGGEVLDAMRVTMIVPIQAHVEEVSLPLD